MTLAEAAKSLTKDPSLRAYLADIERGRWERNALDTGDFFAAGHPFEVLHSLTVKRGWKHYMRKGKVVARMMLRAHLKRRLEFDAVVFNPQDEDVLKPGMFHVSRLEPLPEDQQPTDGKLAVKIVNEW